MQKIPITKKGHSKLEAEIKELKLQRPKITNAIAEARSHGDLSENAEYHAARESLAFLEAKIVDFENMHAQAEIIDVAKLSNDTVKFGAHVTVVNDDTEETTTYIIVGEFEADLKAKRLSINSPLAKALIGKKVDDIIEFTAGGTEKCYVITDIEFKDFDL